MYEPALQDKGTEGAVGLKSVPNGFALFSGKGTRILPVGRLAELKLAGRGLGEEQTNKERKGKADEKTPARQKAERT